MRRSLAPIVTLLLLAAACSSGQGFRFAALSGPMPSLAGPTVQGPSLDPADYRGKVLLVNFWASWCAPCRREQPGLESLWRSLAPGGGVAFVGVNFRDSASAAAAWVDRYGVTYPSVRDPDGAIGARFDVPFLPTTVLVDASGRLRYRLVGEQAPERLRALVETIRSLGAEPGSGPLLPQPSSGEGR